MTHGDRERKRKLSEAASMSSGHHHHQTNQAREMLTRPTYAPAPPPPPPSQPLQDPRVLYNGYVEYTTGNSPLAVQRTRHSKHGHHRRHPHQDAPSHGTDLTDTYERPGKRHRSQRNSTLEEIPSDGELSDTGADIGEISFDDSADKVSRQFNTFNAALADLLDAIDSNTDATFPLLDRVLGRERSSFVKTMKSMQLEGTLPWLAQPRPSSPDLSVAPSQVIQTTSGLTLEPLRPRRLRSSSVEPASSRRVSGASSVRSISSTSSVPPVPFSTNTVDPTVKRAKIWPPELPPIKSDDLRRQVFSHKSIIDGATSGIDGASRHNERLEFLGDSYLGAITTRHVFSRFPTLREGPMSQIRASIIGNKNLQEWCVMYKLEKRMIAGEGKFAELSHRSKTLADLFEAYVGGLLLDSGPEVVDDWLKDLMEPKMKEAAEEINKEKPLDKTAKNQVANLVGGKNVNIEYRWESGAGGNQGGYCFTAHITGWGLNQKLLGKGWGTNKTDASIRAAMNALEGQAIREVKRAKQKWYEENQSQGSVTGSDSGTAIRHDIS